MAALNTTNLADWLVDWDPLGPFIGIAAENDAISFSSLADDPELSTSGDGLVNCLTADSDYRMEITVKLNCGADDTYARLMALWKSGKTISGPLTVSNTVTGEANDFDCVSIKSMPTRSIGFRAGSNTIDVVLHGICVNYTPPANVADAAFETIAGVI